jgi:hypothetical protein
MTYDIIGTYLKGFHLTLASIHPQRDQDGWKVTPRDWLSYLWNAWEEGKLSKDDYSNLFEMSIQTNHEVKDGCQVAKPPKEVLTVPRLRFDLEALETLLGATTPSEVVLRAARIFTILYGFADASRKRFWQYHSWKEWYLI